MNKKIFILIGLATLLLTINLFNLYIKSKNELKSEYQNILLTKNKINQILYLKNKYSNKSLKILRSICSIKNNQIYCNNVSQYALRKINYFLKSNIKIKKFKLIKKDNKFEFYAEINK